jgi:hypothetical protein
MGRVLLNIRIFAQMPLNKLSDANISFVAPKEGGELVKYLVRVKSPNANELFSVIEKEIK